jgi:hypothetical protein
MTQTIDFFLVCVVLSVGVIGVPSGRPIVAHVVCPDRLRVEMELPALLVRQPDQRVVDDDALVMSKADVSVVLIIRHI